MSLKDAESCWGKENRKFWGIGEGKLEKKKLLPQPLLHSGHLQEAEIPARDASAGLAGTEGEKAAAFWWKTWEGLAFRLPPSENFTKYWGCSGGRGGGVKMQVETLPLKSRVKFSSALVRARLECSTHWGRGSPNTMGFLLKMQVRDKPVEEWDSPELYVRLDSANN